MPGVCTSRDCSISQSSDYSGSPIGVRRSHNSKVAFSLRKGHLAHLPTRGRELENRSRLPECGVPPHSAGLHHGLRSCERCSLPRANPAVRSTAEFELLSKVLRVVDHAKKIRLERIQNTLADGQTKDRAQLETLTISFDQVLAAALLRDGGCRPVHLHSANLSPVFSGPGD